MSPRLNWLPMLPPYYWVVSKSKLLEFLEPDHYGVQVTEREKERIACWLDLCVPYCGSYMEANKWDQISHGYVPFYRNQLRPAYLFQVFPLHHAEIEWKHLERFRQHREEGKNFQTTDFPKDMVGGKEMQQAFMQAFENLPQAVPIYGLAEGLEARGGSNFRAIRPGIWHSILTPRFFPFVPIQPLPPIPTSDTFMNTLPLTSLMGKSPIKNIGNHCGVPIYG